MILESKWHPILKNDEWSSPQPFQGLPFVSWHRRHVGHHVENAAEVAWSAALGAFFERGAQEPEGFQSGDAGGAVVEVEMGINRMQPAGGVLDDVVGVQVEDIDFAEEVVIEDEIATEGSGRGIAQVLADESGFEDFPLGMNAVDVGLREDELEPPAFHHAAEQLDLVVEEVVGEQLIAQVVEQRLGGDQAKQSSPLAP